MRQTTKLVKRCPDDLTGRTVFGMIAAPSTLPLRGPMKKIVVAIVAVIAVLLLALPAVLGRLTESQVRERVAAINASGIATADIKSFDSGWFRSKAKIEFGFSPGYLAQLAAQGAPVDAIGRHATIVVDFAHGPVTL